MFIVLQNSTIVVFEPAWCFQVGYHWTMHKKFFLDLRGFLVLAKRSTKEIRGFDLGDRFTFFILRALTTLGLLQVWCALLAYNISVFGKVTIENRPSSFASFAQVIA